MAYWDHRIDYSDLPRGTEQEFWDDVNRFNTTFFKKTPINTEEIYGSVTDEEAFKSADREEALRMCDKLLNHLDKYGQEHINEWTPMFHLRTKATEVRLRVEKIAAHAQVKWSNRGWKGWDLEKKSWQKYKKWKERHNIVNTHDDDMYLHMGNFMLHYFRRMVENLRNCIKRYIESKKRKYRFNYERNIPGLPRKKYYVID